MLLHGDPQVEESLSYVRATVSVRCFNEAGLATCRTSRVSSYMASGSNGLGNAAPEDVWSEFWIALVTKSSRLPGEALLVDLLPTKRDPMEQKQKNSVRVTS